MPQKSRRFKLESPTACVFCGKDEDNEFLYGKFFHKNLSVHQNCLFFASGLSQLGKKESDGILGFRVSDIRKEVLRGGKLKCFHCKKKGATIGCCVAACRRTFHFPCGIQNQALHQFFGSFSSFCQLHRPVQKPVRTTKEELYCHICFLTLSRKDLSSCLYSTCCRRNLYHQTCLQKYALSAGRHFFKCPLCNNSSDFMKEMEFYGICVPEKDASWELEENAYQDLLYRPECGANFCHCANGRKYNGQSAWALLPCTDCGADARHQKCADLEDDKTMWTCDECQVLEDKILKKRMNPEDGLEVTDSNNHLESINQHVPTLEMQSTVSEASCSNICSNDMPCLEAEAGNLQSSSIDDISSLSTSTYECDESPPPVMSPCKVPSISTHMLETEERESASYKRLKHEINPQEPNLNSKKVCFVDNILNQMQRQKKAKKPALILNCNSIKTVTSSRQSKGVLRKRKADKKLNSGCCSGDSQQCIKKMFGLQCHNYRI